MSHVACWAQVNHEWMMKNAAEILGLVFFGWPSAMHDGYPDAKVDMRHATCDMRHATCVPVARWMLRRIAAAVSPTVKCDMRYATSDMQHAACDV